MLEPRAMKWQTCLQRQVANSHNLTAPPPTMRQRVLKQNFKTNWQNRHHQIMATVLNISTSTNWSGGSKPPSSASALDIVVSRNTRKRWGLQRQHSVNVVRLNRHQSTFSKSAHSMKRNVAEFGHMTPRSTPNSGGTSTTNEGRLASPTPPD